jgi:hypothetical protein
MSDAAEPKRAYSFKEGLAMMAAKEVGIDPYLAADAGEDVRSVLAALRRAKTAKGAEKAKHIAAAQTELRKLNPQQHGKLVNALQAKVLALQGRGGDTAVAHLAEGELVLPKELQTKDVVSAVQQAALSLGIDINRFIVGRSTNSVNPLTSTIEFGKRVVPANYISTATFMNRVSPFGRTGQPSDELAAENIIKSAVEEGYGNPANIFKEYFMAKSDSELREIKNTLLNAKRLAEVMGKIADPVATGTLVARALALGLRLTFLGGGAVAVGILGAIHVADYLAESTIALIDVILDARQNGVEVPENVTPGNIPITPAKPEII